MKKKILIPVFASVMALSVSSIVNADEVNDYLKIRMIKQILN
ncbi:hypothetical protein [Clostridioides difficile]|nr:hypothetical protein [Clostridioides difficile]EQF11242.1 putative cell wall hydrolase domain protein [Clostridioides difficile CD132]